MTKKIIVVGAGIAGLTAAYKLRQAGCEVSLLERESYAGGRMADVTMNGLNVHTGATIIWSFYHDMMELAKELGIEDDLVDYQSVYTLDNGEREIQLSVAPSARLLLKNPAISLASKARLTALFPDMVASGLKTDPNFIHTAADFDDGENMAEYIEKRVGKDFLENYVAPLFRIPWSWNVEEISKAYFLSILGHLTTARTMIFRNGIGQLSRALADSLPVTYGIEVVRISGTEDGASVEYHQDGENKAIDADVVICATQGTKAGMLATDYEDNGFFDSVRYNRCAIAYYKLKSPPELMDRWYSREHPSKIAFYAQIPDDPYTPSGKQAPHLYCEATPEVIEEIYQSGNPHNFRCFIDDDVKKLYPAVDNELEEPVVEQWIDEMLPIIYPGYARKVRDFLSEMETNRSSLYFCGDYLSHSHTGGACASGRLVADTVKSHHLN